MNLDPRPASDIDLAEVLDGLSIENVSDFAIVALDKTGHIMSWSTGAERVNGYAAHEILGHSFTELYPPEIVSVDGPRQELERAALNGSFEDESWHIRKDGSRFWASVVITALRDASGALIGFAKVTRDVTARRELEDKARQIAAQLATTAEAARRADELAQLNTQLQDQAVELETQNEELRELTEELTQSNDHLLAALASTERARDEAALSAAATASAYRELDQFAYVASHDLKAPLRGIANLAQWIQDDVGDQLGDESREHMRLLQGRVHRMEALIDGILAYSRAGRVLTKSEQVDVGALVRDVIELLAPASTVTMEIQDALPTVEAERVPLQQVFLNLIGNAIKYAQAHRPSPVINVRWRREENSFVFSVTDNGPGIEPQYHARIWDIFQTLDARDKVEGTGVGLSVVKKIVESRGGQVWLDSTPGDGSAFHFSWPRDIRNTEDKE